MKASMASGPALSQLAATKVVRKKITREIEKTMMNWLTESRADPNLLPGVEDDRIAMGLAVMGSIERALAGRYLSDATIRAILQLLVKGLFFEQGDQTRARVLEEQFHHQAPSFLLISPSKACNLRCEGCNADPNEHPRALEGTIVDRAHREDTERWRTRCVVVSGGQP